MFAGFDTGDNGSLEDNAWNWWPVSSTLMVYGQVLVALDSQVWSTVKFGHVKFVKFGGHIVEAEVAVRVLRLRHRLVKCRLQQVAGL